ncbi:MAG: helix-turn-helix transcriptional regulator [Dermatophilaceae bacterium]
MSEIATRTLELLGLLQAQKEWTGADLAARLAVSTRTVRRDIDRLRELGYPVDAGRGPGSGYRLAPGSTLPPLIFDDEQAIAIALALQTAPSSVQDMGDSVKRALRTVTDLMPEELARRLRTFDVHTIDNAWELAPPTVSPALLASLSSAAQDRHLVKFQYRSKLVDSADDVPVVAEPHKLVVWSGRWHLVAYNQRELSWHAYRLDRISEPHFPGWRFTPHEFPEGNLARFIQLQPDRGDATDSWPCRGTVRMDCPVELVATWAPGGATVESIDDRTTRISMGAWSWAGLLGLLATFDSDFVVEEPDELAEAAGRMAGRLQQAGRVATHQAR